jgi:SAM-dependent methyltransferase
MRTFATLALLILTAATAAAEQWTQVVEVDGHRVEARIVESTPDSTYTYRNPSPDGTGKFYLGREISRVMGHTGADWLERGTREREEAPDTLVEWLPLERGDVVADIGAGTGYFAFRISPRVPEGRVLAVDIQPEMLEIISQRKAARGIDNIAPVLGAVDDTRLPAGAVDLVLMVDAYHEFSHPREMMASIVRGLRPGGRVVLVEYRAEDPDVPIKPLHKMTQKQARAEMSAAGLLWVETLDFLPRQHVMVFAKPRSDATSPQPDPR